MKKIILIILLISSVSVASAVPVVSFPSSNSELLELLDSELSQRHIYTDLRSHKIDSVKDLLAVDSTRTVELYCELGRLHEGLNCDSAIVYYTAGFEMARKACDVVSAQRFLIHRASVLRKLGATADAVRDLEYVRNKGLKDENCVLFYEVERDFFMTLAEAFWGTEMSKNYRRNGLIYAKRHLALLPPDSTASQLCQSLIYFGEGKPAMFLASLLELADSINVSDAEYPMAMTCLGGHCLELGYYDDAVRYLSMAALSEIYRGERQGTGLIRLGSALYKKKDYERAYNYLTIALEDALKSSSKLNCMMISEALMPVSLDIRSYNNRKLMLLTGFVVSLIVAVLLFGHLYMSKRRRVHEIELVKRQLAAANLSKDTYISKFINLCSTYMENLEDFNRMCRRKITAGQTDDLLKFIKDGKVLDGQRKKFEDMFDDSFLSIYPSFIKDLNRLLAPDKQVSTVAPNVLSNELRVLAFTRLGVNDTVQIARFLGVSLNTIYTYRNKLRNKAIARDSFDSDVMKIGAIE